MFYSSWAIIVCSFYAYFFWKIFVHKSIIKFKNENINDVKYMSFAMVAFAISGLVSFLATFLPERIFIPAEEIYSKITRGIDIEVPQGTYVYYTLLAFISGINNACLFRSISTIQTKESNSNKALKAFAESKFAFWGIIFLQTIYCFQALLWSLGKKNNEFLFHIYAIDILITFAISIGLFYILKEAFVLRKKYKFVIPLIYLNWSLLIIAQVFIFYPVFKESYLPQFFVEKNFNPGSVISASYKVMLGSIYLFLLYTFEVLKRDEANDKLRSKIESNLKSLATGGSIIKSTENRKSLERDIDYLLSTLNEKMNEKKTKKPEENTSPKGLAFQNIETTNQQQGFHLILKKDHFFRILKNGESLYDDIPLTRQPFFNLIKTALISNLGPEKFSEANMDNKNRFVSDFNKIVGKEVDIIYNPRNELPRFKNNTIATFEGISPNQIKGILNRTDCNLDFAAKEIMVILSQ